jgi:hypothetical protein
MSDKRTERSTVSEWYVDKGFVRGGFYDELGGMLVGHRAREVCDMLNAHSQLQAELEEVREDAVTENNMKLFYIQVISKLEAELDHRIKPAAQAVVDSSDLCTGLQVVSMSAFHKLKAALEKEK